MPHRALTAVAIDAAGSDVALGNISTRATDLAASGNHVRISGFGNSALDNAAHGNGVAVDNIASRGITTAVRGDNALGLRGVSTGIYDTGIRGNDVANSIVNDNDSCNLSLTTNNNGVHISSTDSGGFLFFNGSALRRGTSTPGGLGLTAGGNSISIRFIHWGGVRGTYTTSTTRTFLFIQVQSTRPIRTRSRRTRSGAFVLLLPR